MKSEVEYKCRICGATTLTQSNYPDAHFNGKVFHYLNCTSCNSYNVLPSPTPDDFSKMYGEEDHSYLKDVKDKIEYNFNYPFANHQGYQIKFLKQIKNQLIGKTLLDYGCGSGFYMKYAEQCGAKVTGIEFDEKFVTLLKEKTNFDLYTFNEAKEKFVNVTFDFIHLGHILEHLPDPLILMKELKQFANSNTTFIIDGPLERNSCLHRLFVDIGSKLKGKKYRNAMPQHLTLTNQKSQLQFFDRLGLKKTKYIITEQYFPLPNKPHLSVGKLFSFVIATFSILISNIIPKHGNIFHYRGVLKDL